MTANSKQLDIHTSAREGNQTNINLLITYGADLNVKDRHSRTPLHLAAWAGHLFTVQSLLETGKCDVNLNAVDDMNALHFAAQKGHLEVCKALLNAGIAVNSKNRKGMNALHLAAQGGHAELVRYLIKRKANPLAENKRGQTALDLSKSDELKQVLEEASAAAREAARLKSAKTQKPQQKPPQKRAAPVDFGGDDYDEEAEDMPAMIGPGPQPTQSEKRAFVKESDREEEDTGSPDHAMIGPQLPSSSVPSNTETT